MYNPGYCVPYCWKKDIGSYLKTIKIWMVKMRAWKRWIWMEVRLVGWSLFFLNKSFMFFTFF
jgi:hypothetical protein